MRAVFLGNKDAAMKLIQCGAMIDLMTVVSSFLVYPGPVEPLSLLQNGKGMDTLLESSVYLFNNNITMEEIKVGQ
jgi:hypothetical protein